VLDKNGTQSKRLWTVGHSNQTTEEFLGLLRGAQIQALVDVRSQPYSRYVPHFSQGELAASVVNAGLHYIFMGDALGGRPKDPTCYDGETVLYDTIRQRDFFLQGIDRLLDGLSKLPVAIMCSEEDPTHCHRRLLVSKTLVRRGVDVFHIRGGGRQQSEKDLAELHLAQEEQLHIFQ
jgi:uncharacterized protein (DUF488 family)